MTQRLYAIGGKSRTGKTKISHRLKSLHKLIIQNTDSFRRNGDDGVAWNNLMSYLVGATFPSDVLIEGVAITPQRIADLNITSLVLQKAVFLGYGRETHANTILSHARQARETDWVWRQLQKNPLYENDVRSWMVTGVPESAQLKIDATDRGYGYFDITDYESFETYAAEVSNYLFS